MSDTTNSAPPPDPTAAAPPPPDPTAAVPAEAQPPVGVVLDDPARAQDTATEATAAELAALQDSAVKVASDDLAAKEAADAATAAAAEVSWVPVPVQLGRIVLFGIDQAYIDSLPERDPNLTPGDTAVAIVTHVHPDDAGVVDLRVFGNCWSTGWARNVAQAPTSVDGDAPSGRYLPPYSPPKA